MSEALLQELADSLVFVPQPGPQTDAYISEADVLLYGGAAGGGKTALACGLAVQAHQQTLFIRRESKQLDGVVDELERLLGPDAKAAGYRGSGSSPSSWSLPSLMGEKPGKIVFGSCPHAGDENRYQGRPRDLLVIDEAANMLESQVRFLMGWVRTTDPNQRTRSLFCSNPPTSADGEWLFRMFAPWLDPEFPDPAEPGELRWAAVVDGEDIWVSGPEPFEVEGEDIPIMPESRTFIPARVTDNQYLMETGYVSTLQALPEPLRSQMLYGDFTAGREDDEWQVIPSEWVAKAQARWKKREFSPADFTSVGCDPSRGGQDPTLIAGRIGWWYAPLKELKGEETSHGAKISSSIIGFCGESMAPVHVDVIGIGSTVVDHLEAAIGSRCVPINAAERADDKDKTGKLKFLNTRASDWWRFRELLDPAGGANIALPPSSRLKAELCAPRYTVGAGGIKIESKDDIKKRLGRSTNEADAVILASKSTPIVQLQRSPTANVSVHGSMNRSDRG